MKTIRKSAVAVRARRLNQPEMIERYSEMAINETDTHYELIDEDWVELNLQWNEHGPSRTSPAVRRSGKSSRARTRSVKARELSDNSEEFDKVRKPCRESSGTFKQRWESFKKEVSEPAWLEEIERFEEWFARGGLTSCEIKARKKKLMSRYREWRKNTGSG